MDIDRKNDFQTFKLPEVNSNASKITNSQKNEM